jgi:hypothetical protein
LLQGTISSDNQQHYSHIATILEDNIHSDGGPFVLVIWTEYAELRADLTAYLDDRLDPEKPHARPLAILCLEKEKYITPETGAVQHPEALREAVLSAITARPQLAALLSWEAEVIKATGATLAALLGLIDPGRRTTAQYPTALNELLSLLANASVGKSNVSSDRRGAITAALAPLLLDRIYNQTTSPESKEVWDRAVTLHQGSSLDDLSPLGAGRLNRMLHVALPGAEEFRSHDWGAVASMPEEWLEPKEMKCRFGAKAPTILGEEFKVFDEGDRARCRFRLVRVGAVCDYAQGRFGPIPYLLGLEIPAEITLARTDRKPPKAEWLSPVLVVDDSPFYLAVNCRYLITVPKSQVKSWTAVYRLREQLLMDLIDYAGGYISRPGKVELRARIIREPVPTSPKTVTAEELGAEPGIASGGVDNSKQTGVMPAIPAVTDLTASPEERSQDSGHDRSADAVTKEPDVVPPSVDRRPEPGPARGKADTEKELCAEPAARAAGDLPASPEQRSQHGGHDQSADAIAKEPDAVPPSGDRQ